MNGKTKVAAFLALAIGIASAISLSNARALLVPIGRVLRDLHGDTPRSEQETKIANESEQDVDPEEVSNPWLTQVLQEAQP